MTQAEHYILLYKAIEQLEAARAALERKMTTIYEVWHGRGSPPCALPDGSAIHWENGRPFTP